jgi:hypothetical protein
MIELIRDIVSRDTVEALEQLLGAARTGDITGIAFAAALKRRKYITNVAGSCYRYPTFARGMLGALDDELSNMIHGRDIDETR